MCVCERERECFSRAYQDSLNKLTSYNYQIKSIKGRVQQALELAINTYHIIDRARKMNFPFLPKTMKRKIEWKYKEFYAKIQCVSMAMELSVKHISE